MKKLWYLLILLLGLGLFIAGCGGSEDASNDGSSDSDAEAEEGEESVDSGDDSEEEEIDYPTEDLDWTIAFGPGGGNDVMAREMISIMEEYDMYPENIVPENREGGSGAVGWGHLVTSAGDPHQISTTSGSFITTPLQSDPGWAYDDFTHIALMATDDMFILVPGDSEYETLEEFLAASEEETMNIGGIGTANVDRMIAETLGEEAGVEFEYVSFNAVGEAQSALLSGSLDAMMGNPSDAIGQMESGDMKALAFSGQEELPDYPDIPTFIDEGYDVNISMPRGVILPPDIDPEVRDWWIETMKEIAETDEWAEYIEKNYLTETILYGDEFTEYLDETTATFDEILTDLGVLED